MTDCSRFQIVSGKDLAIQVLWEMHGTSVPDSRNQDILELLILDKREARSPSCPSL